MIEKVLKLLLWIMIIISLVAIISMLITIYSNQQERINVNNYPKDILDYSDIDYQNDKETISVETFLKKVKGFWGRVNSEEQWDILEFSNGKISDYTYEGHTWLSDGEIEKIVMLSDGMLEATISYQEIVYGESETPEREECKYVFKTNDDYQKTLITCNQEEEYIYIFLGNSIEEFKKNIMKEENAHSNKKIPYVSAKSSYLGTSANLLEKKGVLSSYIAKMSPRVEGIVDTEADGITYRADSRHNYIGIKGDEVVAYITYAFPTENMVRDVLSVDELYITEPYIYTYDTHEGGSKDVRLYWRLDNGFYIISAMAFENDWLKYRPYFIMHVKDLAQCPCD